MKVCCLITSQCSRPLTRRLIEALYTLTKSGGLLKKIIITTLPVYRLNEERYYTQRQEFVEKTIFGGPDGAFKRQYAKEDPQWYSTFKTHLCDVYGGAWNFNEIIGYIELYIIGNQVRGSYWQDNKRRFSKSRRKQFIYKTHKLMPEVSFSRRASSEDIYCTILEYIDNCQTYLKGRHIDRSNLINMGKYVNWRTMVDGA
ncbi:hypothetical protein KLNKPBOH_01690 [Aeromonas veronii]